MVTHVYIVWRGDEIDVYTDYDLAAKAAEFLGERVNEEPVLTADFVDELLREREERGFNGT